VLTALNSAGLKPATDFEIVLGDCNEQLGLGSDSHVVQIDVQQPLIARRVVEQLLWRIKNPFERGPIGISVMPRLVTSDEENGDGPL
jgi:DNA-binding LacI/PurR family transcriptional regulator